MANAAYRLLSFAFVSCILWCHRICTHHNTVKTRNGLTETYMHGTITTLICEFILALNSWALAQLASMPTMPHHSHPPVNSNLNNSSWIICSNAARTSWPCLRDHKYLGLQGALRKHVEWDRSPWWPVRLIASGFLLRTLSVELAWNR